MEVYIIIGIIGLIIILLVFYIIGTYNKLVKRRNRVNTQWAQIEVQLVRRTDLIPNLVETVKAYAAHEKAIFEKIAAERDSLNKASSPGQKMEASDRLSDQLLQLFAVAEAYPNLKADSSFVNLQSALKETEDKIAYARQFYNDTVLIYKDIIHQFPSNIIAKRFKFNDELYYIVREDKNEKIKI